MFKYKRKEVRKDQIRVKQHIYHQIMDQESQVDKDHRLKKVKSLLGNLKTKTQT